MSEQTNAVNVPVPWCVNFRGNWKAAEEYAHYALDHKGRLFQIESFVDEYWDPEDSTDYDDWYRVISYRVIDLGPANLDS